jgi:ADP-ribose pyrophosphatase YjhB (NUDIX family)
VSDAIAKTPADREVERYVRNEVRLQEAVMDVYASLGMTNLRDLQFQVSDFAGIPGSSAVAPPWYQQNQKYGEALPVYRTEVELRMIRDRMRILAATNEFALCALEARTNYVVGESGLKYSAAPCDPCSRGDKDAAARVQAVIDTWCEINDTPTLEADALFRLDVEGEFFIRSFNDREGWQHLRFVHPEHVTYPGGDTDDAGNSFGVVTDRDDTETVHGYHVIDDPRFGSLDTEYVSASKILHVKANTLRGAKRGLPTFYPVEQNLKRCEDLLASMSSVAKARAKIALIRKITGLTSPTANTLLNSLTAVRATDPATNETLNIERLRYGTVLTASGNTDYQFPQTNLGASDIIEVLQAELRAVASRMQMAEWMFTALADAKYSNAFVVEAPTLKSFGKLQRILRNAFGLSRYGHRKSLLWRQLRRAVDAGILEEGDLDRVTLSCVGPTLETRDKTQEVERHKELVASGFESVETAQRALDLDPDVESPLIERDRVGKARPVADMAAVAQIQSQFYAGTLPRDAAAANLMILMAFTREQAEALLPASDCVNRVDNGQPDPAAGGMPGAPGDPAAGQPPAAAQPGEPAAPVAESTEAQADALLTQALSPQEQRAAPVSLPLDGRLLTLRENFTGVVTASNGVQYHYVDGVRVSAADHASHESQHGKASPVVAKPDPAQFEALIHVVGEHYAKGDASWKVAGKAIDKVLKKYGGGLAEWQELAAKFGLQTTKKSSSELIGAIKQHLETQGVNPQIVAAAKGDPSAMPKPADEKPADEKPAEEKPQPAGLNADADPDKQPQTSHGKPVLVDGKPVFYGDVLMHKGANDADAKPIVVAAAWNTFAGVTGDEPNAIIKPVKATGIPSEVGGTFTHHATFDDLLQHVKKTGAPLDDAMKPAVTPEQWGELQAAATAQPSSEDATQPEPQGDATPDAANKPAPVLPDGYAVTKSPEEAGSVAYDLKHGDKNAGGITITTPSADGDAAKGAAKDFPGQVKPGETVATVDGVFLPSEHKGKGIGQALYLAGLAAHGADWIYGKSNTGDATNVYKALAAKGLIGVQWAGGKEPDWNEKGVAHLAKLTDAGKKAAGDVAANDLPEPLDPEPVPGDEPFGGPPSAPAPEPTAAETAAEEIKSYVGEHGNGNLSSFAASEFVNDAVGKMVAAGKTPKEVLTALAQAGIDTSAHTLDSSYFDTVSAHFFQAAPAAGPQAAGPQAAGPQADEPKADEPTPAEQPATAQPSSEQPKTPAVEPDGVPGSFASLVEEAADHKAKLANFDDAESFLGAVSSSMKWAQQNGHDPAAVMQAAGYHPNLIKQVLAHGQPAAEQPKTPAAAIKAALDAHKAGQLDANAADAAVKAAIKAIASTGGKAGAMDALKAAGVNVEGMTGPYSALAAHLPAAYPGSEPEAAPTPAPAPTVDPVKAAAADLAAVLGGKGLKAVKLGKIHGELTDKHGPALAQALKAAGLKSWVPHAASHFWNAKQFKQYAEKLKAHADGVEPSPATPAAATPKPAAAKPAAAPKPLENVAPDTGGPANVAALPTETTPPAAPAVQLGAATGYVPQGFEPAAQPAKSYAGKLPQEIDPSWQVNPNPEKQAYGGVVVRTGPDGKIQVLLRKPSGGTAATGGPGYDNYAWTWPKGKLQHGQGAHGTAVAEVGEETGHKAEVIGHLPGVFKSDGTTTNAFFVMKSTGEDPSLMDTETHAVQWVDIDKAHELIGQTTKPAGKARDLAILEAAKKHLGGGTGDPKIATAAENAQKTIDKLVAVQAPPEKVAAVLADGLKSYSPAAVAAIAAKLGTTPDKLVQHAVDKVHAGAEHHGFPAAVPADAKPIGEGSTGAKSAVVNGQKYVIKDGGTTAHGQEQVGNEVAADKIYKLLGASVPPSKLVTQDGKQHKVAKWVDGAPLKQYLANATPEQAAAVKSKIQQHFVATALLGNWDVVGLNHDNVKVGPDGTPHLIDNGGSFDISANASKKGAAAGKPFEAKVGELATLLDPKTAPQAAGVFKGVTKADIKAQIGNVVKQKAAILAATPDAHKKTMAARIDYLQQWAATDGKPNAKKLSGGPHGDVHVSPNPGVHIYTHQLAKVSHPAAVEYLNHVTPQEAAMVHKYTGGSYRQLNQLLYTKKGVAGHAAMKELDDGLQGAFAKASPIPVPLTLKRKVDLKSVPDAHKLVATLERSMTSGQPMKWRSYMSAGPGGTFGNSSDTTLTIENVTEGAIDLKPLSGIPSEEELLLNRGTFYHVVKLEKNSKGGYNIVLRQTPAAEAAKGKYMEQRDAPDAPADATDPGEPQPLPTWTDEQRRQWEAEHAKHAAEMLWHQFGGDATPLAAQQS